MGYYDQTTNGKSIGFKGDKSCYDAVKYSITSSLEFNKDAEFVSKDGDLTFCYSDGSFGVVFSKSVNRKSSNGMPSYFVDVMGMFRYKYIKELLSKQ